MKIGKINHYTVCFFPKCTSWKTNLQDFADFPFWNFAFEFDIFVLLFLYPSYKTCNEIGISSNITFRWYLLIMNNICFCTLCFTLYLFIVIKSLNYRLCCNSLISNKNYKLLFACVKSAFFGDFDSSGSPIPKFESQGYKYEPT